MSRMKSEIEPDPITPSQPEPETGASSNSADPTGLLCAFVLAFAVLDMLGWIFHLPLLTSVFPHYSTMKPNTGTSLGLLAIGLTMQQRHNGRVKLWLKIASGLVIALALVLGIGTLLEYASNADLGIDGLIIPVPGDRPGDPAGRMAIATATCISLLGLATFFLEQLPILSTTFYIAVFGTSISALLGFIFNAGPLFGVRWFTSVAVHTALCLFLLSLAGLFSRPEREPLRSLIQRGYRKGRSRWLLAGVTLFPLAVALPPAIAMRLHLIDSGFGLALVIVVLTAAQTWILWRDNITLSRADRHRQKVEAALFQSEKLAVVGRLSASISHEIKNPLEAVNTLMYLVRDAQSLDEARSFALTAESELERINHITNQTLAFSRDARSNTRCSPTEIAESALRLLVSKIRAGRIVINKDFAPNTGEVDTNPGELRQVLINLISNAVDATPPEGHVAVRIRRSKSWVSRTRPDRVPGVRIVIADNGSGISSELQRHIFEPFFTTKLETGNGLGLWVAKNLMQKAGGSIQVWSSTLPGSSGTTFAIFLPLGSVPEAQALQPDL